MLGVAARGVVKDHEIWPPGVVVGRWNHDGSFKSHRKSGASSDQRACQTERHQEQEARRHLKRSWLGPREGFQFPVQCVGLKVEEWKSAACNRRAPVFGLRSLRGALRIRSVKSNRYSAAGEKHFATRLRVLCRSNTENLVVVVRRLPFIRDERIRSATYQIRELLIAVKTGIKAWLNPLEVTSKGLERRPTRMIDRIVECFHQELFGKFWTCERSCGLHDL